MVSASNVLLPILSQSMSTFHPSKVDVIYIRPKKGLGGRSQRLSASGHLLKGHHSLYHPSGSFASGTSHTEYE
jgi:hypothetical protein